MFHNENVSPTITTIRWKDSKLLNAESAFIAKVQLKWSERKSKWSSCGGFFLCLPSVLQPIISFRCTSWKIMIWCELKLDVLLFWRAIFKTYVTYFVTMDQEHASVQEHHLNINIENHFILFTFTTKSLNSGWITKFEVSGRCGLILQNFLHINWLFLNVLRILLVH